jgi:DNA-binding transcriptional ArsR family regulator
MNCKLLWVRGMIGTVEPIGSPSMEGLPNDALVQVAAYFQALSEPTRLQILNQLRQQARSVGELAGLCGYSSANISRHLALLAQQGLVSRETRGNSAYFHITDPAVYRLCDLVCGSIARQFESTAGRRAAFVAAPARKARPKARPSPKA